MPMNCEWCGLSRTERPDHLIIADLKRALEEAPRTVTVMPKQTGEAMVTVDHGDGLGEQTIPVWQHNQYLIGLDKRL